MAESRKLTLLPRAGRGLITNYSPQSMGDLIDSFLEFENLYIRDSAWVARVRESSEVYAAMEAPIRSQHAYNKVVSTSGTIAFRLLAVGGTKLYRVDTGIAFLKQLVSPYELMFETVKNRVFYAGSNNPPEIWDGTSIVSWGANGPSADMTYLALDDSSNPFSKIDAATVSATAGSPTIAWTGGDIFPPDPVYVQKPIYIDGIAYRVLTVLSSISLTLTANYLGATGGHASYVHSGEMSWIIPPKYAYSYYNPTTGHITNASPVLQLSEQNISNVRVALRTIMTNPTLFAMGYTKIVLFRTRVDGSDLSDLYAEAAGSVDADGDGFLNNKNTLVSLEYNDEGADTRLGILLGATQHPTLNKPAPMMRFIAYWDGRFWGIEEARQWRLRYSGNANDIPLGVAEECWPEVFFRDVPSSDGYATGLKVVGTTLLILTDRYTFYVAGGANNYTLVRLSTRGFGVSQNAIAEHPGDSTTDSASAIYVSRDKRLWRHYEAGRIEDMGAAIQDVLDLGDLSARHPYMVRVVRLGKLWLCVLGIATSATTAYRLYFYDFDAKAWYDWTYNVGFQIVISDVIGYLFMAPGFSNTGTSYVQLGRYDQGGFALLGTSLTNFTGWTAHFKTQHFDHGDRTAYKAHETVWVHVNDVTLGPPEATWKLTTYYDESETGVVWNRVTLDSGRDPGGHILCFNPPAVKQWKSCSYRLDIPGTDQFGNVGKAYRFEVVFKNLSTGISGEPT